MMGPPCCTHGLRVPASCALYVPEAQGSLPRDPTHCMYALRVPVSGLPYAHQPRACRTYRVPWGAPQVLGAREALKRRLDTIAAVHGWESRSARKSFLGGIEPGTLVHSLAAEVQSLDASATELERADLLLQLQQVRRQLDALEQERERSAEDVAQLQEDNFEARLLPELPTYGMRTACPLHVHCMSTACPLHGHCMYCMLCAPAGACAARRPVRRAQRPPRAGSAGRRRRQRRRWRWRW